MILALDVGAKVGWARSDGTCGFKDFTDDDHGVALAEFNDWIEAKLDAAPLTTLAIEPPRMRGGFNHRLTLLIEGVAHMEASVRSIPRTQRYATQVRNWLLGFPAIPKQPGLSKARRDIEMDKLVLAAVRARGFQPDSEHAADACAVICMIEQRMPRASLTDTRNA